MGAFVLPNAIIPDEAPLESFVMPGESALMMMDGMLTGIYPKVEAVERATGLTFFSDAVKSASIHICKAAQCQLVVRRFDDAQRNLNRKAIVARK